MEEVHLDQDELDHDENRMMKEKGGRVVCCSRSSGLQVVRAQMCLRCILWLIFRYLIYPICCEYAPILSFLLLMSSDDAPSSSYPSPSSVNWILVPEMTACDLFDRVDHSFPLSFML